jgi:hypothetical protein
MHIAEGLSITRLEGGRCLFAANAVAMEKVWECGLMLS